MVRKENKLHRYEELRGENKPLDIEADMEVVILNPISANGVEEYDSSTDYAAIESIEKTNEKVGTVLSGYFNISNTIMGASVLGLPYAYAHTGWLLGTILLIICAISSAFSLHTLSLCAMKLNKETEENQTEVTNSATSGASFYSVGKATLPSLTLVIDIAIALKCFGVAISYLIVVGDLMPDVMRHCGSSGILLRRELWVLIGWCIAAPYAVMKDLNSLATVSSLALVFVGFFALLVILYGSGIPGMDPCEGIEQAHTCRGEIQSAVLDHDSMKAIPIFVFGFTCQQNIFTVCNEMANISVGKVNRVVAGAVGTGLVLYLILATVGYATFGANVEADLLKSYPETYFTSVARVFISLLVLLSYPLQIHPARRCVLTVIAQCTERSSSGSSAGNYSSGSKYCSSIFRGSNNSSSNSSSGSSNSICWNRSTKSSVEPAEAAVSPRLRSTRTPGVYKSLAAGPSASSLLASRNCSPRTLPLLTSNSSGSSSKLSAIGDGSTHSTSSSTSSSRKIPKLLSPDDELELTGCVDTDNCTAAIGNSSRSEDFLFMVVTMCFLALTLLIAITVKDLSIVLALVGATGSTTVSYILPGFFYYLLFKDPQDGPGWKRYAALVQGILGILLIPFCLVFIFL